MEKFTTVLIQMDFHCNTLSLIQNEIHKCFHYAVAIKIRPIVNWSVSMQIEKNYNIYNFKY